MFYCILLCCYKNRSQLKNSSKNKACKCSTKFFIWLLIYTYFIDYLEKSLYMLWLDPLVMRLGCNKCSATLRLRCRVGRQQRIVHDHSFATSICVTTADYRKRQCRQPNFDATQQFAGQSLATPASESRPGTHLNNDNLRDCSPANFWRQRLRK